MSRLQIFTSDKQEFDLSKSEPIALTLVANDIAKLEKLNTNLSNNFSLPRTSTNETLLGLCTDINSSSENPYVKIPVYILQDGLEIEGFSNAIMIINEIKSNSIEVTVYGNGYNLMAALGDLTLNDLPLTEYSHIKTVANVVTGVNATESNGWCYPVADWGADGNNIVTNGNKNINAEYLYPAIYVRKILDKIFERVGKSYTMPAQIAAYLQKQIITVTNTKQNVDNIPVTALLGKRYINETTGAFINNTPVDISYTDIENIALYEGIYKKVKVKWSVSVEITLNEYPPTGLVDCTLELLSNWYNFYGSPDPDIYDMLDYYQISWMEGVDPQTQIIEFTYEITTSLFRFWYNNIDIGIFNPFEKKYILGQIVLQGLTAGYSVDYKLNQTLVTYEYLDFPTGTDLSLNSLIHFSEWLPKLTQKDFIKAICGIHGLVPFYDEYTETVYFKMLTDVYDNVNSGNVYDWSSKLVSQIPVKQSFDLGFAQKNNVVLKKDKLDEAVDMKVYDHVLYQENENIESEKEIIKIPFAASYLVTRINDDSIPKIKKVKTSGEEKPEVRYLHNNAISNGAPAITISSTNVNTFNLYRTPIVSNDAYRGYSFYNGETGGGEIYGVLRNNPKKVTLFFDLKTTDILNFDFLKPIYLEQFSSYFYCNKIINFIDGKTTEVELIKL